MQVAGTYSFCLVVSCHANAACLAAQFRMDLWECGADGRVVVCPSEQAGTVGMPCKLTPTSALCARTPRFTSHGTWCKCCLSSWNKQGLICQGVQCTICEKPRMRTCQCGKFLVELNTDFVRCPRCGQDGHALHFHQHQLWF